MELWIDIYSINKRALQLIREPSNSIRELSNWIGELSYCFRESPIVYGV